MSTFNVITPFSRLGNLSAMKAVLASQGIHWHLLMDTGATIIETDPWIHVYNFRRPPTGFFPGHWFYNLFLDDYLIDDQYYNLMTDDDSFEPGMFDKLRGLEDPVLVTSMNRGKWGVLWATPGHIKIGSMGLEQLHVKGWLLKDWRLNGFYEADGFFIERLWEAHSEKFKFVPEAQCYFNHLPPGNAALW